MIKGYLGSNVKVADFFIHTDQPDVLTCCHPGAFRMTALDSSCPSDSSASGSVELVVSSQLSVVRFGVNA